MLVTQIYLKAILPWIVFVTWTRIAELFYQLFGVLVQTRMIYHQWKLVMIFKACNFLFLCWVCILAITNLLHLLLELKSQPLLILKSFVRVINCKANLFLHRKNHYWHESEKWTILRYMLQDCLQSKLWYEVDLSELISLLHEY